MTRALQFDLLNSPLAGTSLIEAGAGTGKTYTIAGLFLRLIVEQELPVNEILVVTFTTSATKELRDRIRRNLADALKVFDGDSGNDEFLVEFVRKHAADKKRAAGLIKNALANFDEAAIYTIHGFCGRVLHENAFETNSLFDTEMIAGQETIIREIAEDFWRKNFYTAPDHIVSYALSKKFNLDVLNALSRTVVQKHDIAVQPDTPPPSRESIRICMDDVLDSYSVLRKAWISCHGDIEELLVNSELNRNVYRKDRIQSYMREMDLYLTHDTTPAIPLPEKFELFTSEKLALSAKKNKTPPQHDFFDQCQRHRRLCNQLTQLMDDYLLGLKREFFHYCRAELPKRKQAKNIQYFDDLLLSVRDALKGKHGSRLASTVSKQYKAALIDEFQDTDPVQYAVFDAVFRRKGRILFLIGDPKQAIYSFRGADLFAYMKASRSVDAKFTLARNYRSEPLLIDAVNTIFSGAHNPFVYDEIPFHPATAPDNREYSFLEVDGKKEAPFHVWYLDPQFYSTAKKTGAILAPLARDAVCSATGREILRLLELGRDNKAFIGDRPLKAGDIAVLVRSHSEAQLMRETLTRLNIPAVHYKSGNIFDTAEAAETARILAAVEDPANPRLLKSSLATSIHGLTAPELERLNESPEEWTEYLERYRLFNDVWRSHNFMRMMRLFLQTYNVRERLLSYRDGERRLTNMLHLCELLQKQAMTEHPDMSGLIKWFADRRYADKDGADEHMLRLENDANAVQVVTIHKSKGLEYPVVFCPFTWGGSKLNSREEAVFHDPDTDEVLTVDLGKSDSSICLAEQEQLAENIRLLYVALTRARNRCYLAWGRINKAESSAPAYVLHQPARLDQEGSIVDGLGQSVLSLSDTDFRARVEQLEDRGNGCIRVSDLPRPDSSYAVWSDSEAGGEVLRCRGFSGGIHDDWRVSSFSAIASHGTRQVELPDYDGTAGSEPEFEMGATVEKPGDTEWTIFSFPRGTRAGTFFHDIFENLDYTEQDDAEIKKVIQDKLKVHGFDFNWLNTVFRMVMKVVNAPLLDGRENLRLSKIAWEDRMNELEFFFPLKKIRPQTFSDVFSKTGVLQPNVEIPEWIDRLQFSPTQGFMKGYIDLVFRFDGRYYLLDWKSNHLGESVDMYDRVRLETAMSREMYTLQYFLYTAALDKYLSVRLTDYSYENHMGGVFYLFLRGMDNQSGTRPGVFHTVPPGDLIRRLSAALIADSDS